MLLTLRYVAYTLYSCTDTYGATAKRRFQIEVKASIGNLAMKLHLLTSGGTLQVMRRRDDEDSGKEARTSKEEVLCHTYTMLGAVNCFN